MTSLNLSVAVGDYDRTRALVDGRVGIDGVNPIYMLLSPEEMFFRAFRHQAFDVSELSLSSYVVSLTRDDPPYIALPVFLSRAFRHTSVYIRNDRGIETPQDLKGRKIGIAEYQLTANVWVRAILEDDHGVRPSDIHWVRGGMNSPGRPEKLKIELPPDVTLTQAPADRSLNDLLEAGEIDGFVGPRWPRCFDQGHPKVSRLFGNSVEVASDYYRRTRIFPIMHVLGVRRSLVEQHRWLPGALLKAFSAAKEAAREALNDTSATKVTMPFVEDQLLAARQLMGADFWSYGVGPNRHVLEHFLGHHHRQGLSSRLVTVDELFDPASLEAYSL
ncbi:MAG: ABC transporter substrate-binding protein [Burkholderiaceae bacterium]